MAQLIGGSRDGENVATFRGQRLLFIARMITSAEAEALVIDERSSFKRPEDVYICEHLLCTFSHTVHYKP